jgi:hypothetical protein
MDDLVISLSAKGLTHGQICAHLAEVYDAQVSKQTITAITERVAEGLAQWQNRPLEPVYPVVFVDAINVKIRDGQVANRPIYLALGVTVDGERDILGMWAGEHGDGEGAKYWLRVLSQINNRGVADVCMLVCDGLKGLPDAVNHGPIRGQGWSATRWADERLRGGRLGDTSVRLSTGPMRFVGIPVTLPLAEIADRSTPSSRLRSSATRACSHGFRTNGRPEAAHRACGDHLDQRDPAAQPADRHRARVRRRTGRRVRIDRGLVRGDGAGRPGLCLQR